MSVLVGLGCCKGVSRKTQDEITIQLILQVMVIVLSTFQITESCEKPQSILILRAFNYTDYLKKKKESEGSGNENATCRSDKFSRMRLYEIKKINDFIENDYF